MEKTLLLSALRKEADEHDYLGKHMEYIYTDDETGDVYLDIRAHDLPSYGYCDPKFEGTPEWYDRWWSLMWSINLTKGRIETVHSGANYLNSEVIIDEEVDYTKTEGGD